MNKTLRALLEQKTQKLAAARAISDGASAANRDLDDAENAQFAALMGEVSALDARIDRERALIDAERGAVALAVEDPASIRVEGPAVLQSPTHGFQAFGEFATAVLRAGRQGGGRAAIDERLSIVAAAPSTYGSEGNAGDGGYLVPPEFSRQVAQHSLEEDSILPLTDQIPVSGNSLTFPRDETTPWGSDGIRAYWANEAATGTGTKPKGALSSLRLSKLFALVPITDELAEDATALDAYIGRKSGESIRWKMNEAFFAGTGVGQPLGILSHAAAVSVAKESGQAADTVNATNVAKMLARLPAASVGRSRWMINNDVLPQLIGMTIGNQPVFTPPNAGLTAAPFGLLLGRPIMLSQHCKTVGDLGDIVLVDWGMYRTITKAGAGLQTAMSMHLYFDAGLSAFRMTFRVDGQPAINSSISPANGSNSLSPFVFLAERA